MITKIAINLNNFLLYQDMASLLSKLAEDERVERLLIVLVLLVGFSLHLIRIQAPLLGYHSWRQCATAMVARNFLRNGFNLWYPQVDLAGPNPGTWGAEFQIYPFMVALLYKLFGIREWLGLLLASGFAAGTGFIFYLLVRGLLGKAMGLLSLALLNIFPVFVYFTRAFMPESLMLLASVLSVFLARQWTQKKNPLWAVFSGLTLALAISLKANAGYLFIPIAWLLWQAFRLKAVRRWELWAFLTLSLCLPILWYLHARHLEFSINVLRPGTDPKWGSLSLWLSWKFYHRVIFQWACEQTLLYPGFALALTGLFGGRKNPDLGLFRAWLIGVGVSFLFVAGGTFVHVYYTLPLVIPGATFAGYAVMRLWTQARPGLRLLTRLLAIGCIAGMTYMGLQKLLRWTRPDWTSYYAAVLAKDRTPPQSLLLVCDDGQPELLYYADRKGWHLHPEECIPETLVSLRARGAAYFLTTWAKDLQMRPGLSLYLKSNLSPLFAEGNTLLAEFR